MEFVWFVVIGLIAGWLAGVIVKGGGYGLIGDIGVGVVGALIGGMLFKLLRIGTGGFIGNIIVATIGALILIFILRMIKRCASLRRPGGWQPTAAGRRDDATMMSATVLTVAWLRCPHPRYDAFSP